MTTGKETMSGLSIWYWCNSFNHTLKLSWEGWLEWEGFEGDHFISECCHVLMIFLPCITCDSDKLFNISKFSCSFHMPMIIACTEVEERQGWLQRQDWLWQKKSLLFRSLSPDPKVRLQGRKDSWLENQVRLAATI